MYKIKQILFTVLIYFLSLTNTSFAGGAGAGWRDLIQEANKLAIAHKYEEAIGIGIDALKIAKENTSKNHYSITISLARLSHFYNNVGKYDEAKNIDKKLFKILENLDTKDSSLGVALNALALSYFKQGKYSEASKFYERALKIFEYSFGEENIFLLGTLNNLALVYNRQGYYEKSEMLYGRALIIAAKNGTLKDILITSNNLVDIYIRQKKYTIAKLASINFLQAAEEEFGLEHLVVAQTLDNLSLISENEKNYVEAEALRIRALNIRKKVLGIGHTDTAQSLSNLGQVYIVRGKKKEALKLFKEALKILDKNSNSQGPVKKAVLESIQNLEQVINQDNKNKRI